MGTCGQCGRRPGGGSIGLNALFIPTRAVMGPVGARSVVIVRQGKSERRIIRVGPDIDGRIEVLEGLSLGDTVIVAGQALLRDGSTVRIVPPLSPGEAPASPGVDTPSAPVTPVSSTPTRKSE